MKVPFSALVATFIAACVGCGDGDRVVEPVARKAEVLASPEELDDALMKVVDLHSDSYHSFLRDASLLMNPRFVGQPWDTAMSVLEKHQFPVVKSWENGAAIHRYFLLKKDAFQFSNGQSLDLYLLASAWNTDPPKEPVRPGKLFAAHAALVAAVEVPYREMIAQERFPPGSVLDVVLRSDKVAGDGARWPLVKEVYVYYQYLFDRWVDYSPSGFEVRVEFAASLEKEIAGKTLSFKVPSGFDPLRSFDDKVEPSIGFTPQDTLGKISEAGGDEWWQGEPGEIEVNQRKYLNHGN
jgi:hypothetical protein